jgi:hypothetical protein
MAQPTQFTSAQILEAGRRAEAQGQRDYAIQFYRHIVEHHATAPETREARDGIARLTSIRPPEPVRAGVPRTGPPAASGLVPNGAGFDGAPRLNGQLNGHAPPHLNGHANSASGPSIPQQPMLPQPPPRAITPPPSPFAATPAGPVQTVPLPPLGHTGGPAGGAFAMPRAVHLPAPVRAYRFSRGVAYAILLFGAILLLGGLVAFGSALATLITGNGAFGLPANPQLMGTLAAGGMGSSIVGLILIFAAQTSLALFDTANATRDMATVLRAVAGADTGHHRGSGNRGDDHR